MMDNVIKELLCHTTAAVDEPVDHACPFASLSPGMEPVSRNVNGQHYMSF